MQYTIIEKSPRNDAAYVLDLAGCVATGASREEAVRQISQAIRFHVESLRLVYAVLLILSCVSQADPVSMTRLRKGLDEFLERDQDRALFDLAPKEASH